MEHREVEFKVKSTSWQGYNLRGNNEVEFFDLTGARSGACRQPTAHRPDRQRGREDGVDHRRTEAARDQY